MKLLYEELKIQWGSTFVRDQRMRDLVNRKNKVELLPITNNLSVVPVEIHTGKSGTILNHAQPFIGTLPTFIVKPVDSTTLARRDSEQTERVFQSLFFQQLVANDFWANLGRGMLMIGRGVITSLPLATMWTTQEGFPVRKKGQRAQAYIAEVNTWKEASGKIPLMITTTPADDILLKLDKNDKVMVSLEIMQVNAEIVATNLDSKEVQELLTRKRLNWYDELLVLQYIDDVHVAYFLLGTTPVRQGAVAAPSANFKKLKSWEHGLGKCPVVFIPGMKTDEKDYELRFKPFLADAEEPLEAYDFLVSRQATMVKAFYFPSFEWQVDPPTGDLRAGVKKREHTINLGGVTTTFKDEILKPLQMTTNLPDAQLLLGELDELIQQATLEDVLFGKVEDSTAGFAIRLRINVAKTILIPYVTHLAQALIEVMDLVLRSVEQLGSTVMINGEEITVAMAKAARGRVSVSIDAQMPGEEGIDLGKASMAQALNLPEVWYWETILGISDPAALQLMRDVQELEKDPQIKELLLQEAKEKLQLMIEDDETVDILDALTQFGDRLDPEVISALSGLAGGDQSTEGTPPPPPSGGPGRGPFVEGGSPQAVGGGRGTGTPNAPRPEEEDVRPGIVEGPEI